MRNNSLVMAFLYVLAVFHRRPPPQVPSQPAVLRAKMVRAASRYRLSRVMSKAATQASAHQPLSS